MVILVNNIMSSEINEYLIENLTNVSNANFINLNEILRDESIYNKITIIDLHRKYLYKLILKSNTRNERLGYESKLEILKKYLIYILEDPDKLDILVKSYYPNISEKNFSKKISEISRFKQYKISSIKNKEAFTKTEGPNFERSSIQNFVSNFVSPDTPYNGILLWHGVGVGKTCAGLSIASNFIEFIKYYSKKILILTPSSQLHKEWRKEIFNIGKETLKNKYNVYLKNGGDNDYYKWLSSEGKDKKKDSKEIKISNLKPIVNVQCTGNIHTPPNIELLAKDKNIKKDIKKSINDIYEFGSYNIIVNQLEKQERLLQFTNSKNIEGELIQYIIKTYSNRVIIMDEVHRVKEDDIEGKNSTFSKKGPDSILDVDMNVYFKEKNSTRQIHGTIKKVNISERNEYTYDIVYKVSPLVSETEIDIPRNRIWISQDKMMNLKMIVLKLIAKYAKNTKLILLSATPMYKKPLEILDLLDILLLNDGKSIINKSQIFKSNSDQLLGEDESDERTNAILLLNDCSRGYISYVRGENPDAFPVRLEPSPNILLDDKSDKHNNLIEMGYEPRPVFKFSQSKYLTNSYFNRIDTNDWISKLFLYKNIMGKYQFACWYALCYYSDKKNYKTKKWIDGSLLETKPPTHISIFSFPVLSNKNIKSIFANKINEALHEKIYLSYGKEGFNTCFTQDVGSGRYKIKDSIENSSFLQLEKMEDNYTLRDYSIKMYNILRLINSCDGVVFIYSEYVQDGCNMMAAVLEANGYIHYSENTKWDGKGWKGGENYNFLHDDHIAKGEARRDYKGNFIEKTNVNNPQGRYILLTGDVNISKTGELIEELNSYNSHGEKIKVIIGSKKTREGFTFKNVRQIHILDPWYHLNSIDQSTGRGIRNRSHDTLSLEKRNVTMFLHSASLPNYDINNIYKNSDLYTLFSDILPYKLESIVLNTVDKTNKNELKKIKKLVNIETKEKDDDIYISGNTLSDEKIKSDDGIKDGISFIEDIESKLFEEKSSRDMLIIKKWFEYKNLNDIYTKIKDNDYMIENNIIENISDLLTISIDIYVKSEIIGENRQKFVIALDDLKENLDYWKNQYPNNSLTLIESSDEYMYRKAFETGKAINKIARILYKNSIDCELNIEGNMFPIKKFDTNGINPYPIITSQSKEITSYRIGNEDGTWKCGFDKCEYKCNVSDKSDTVELKSYDTFVELNIINSNKIKSIKEIVKEMFQIKLYYSLTEIKSYINLNHSDKYSNNDIYKAINSILRNNESVYDSLLREGYIIYRKANETSYYIFQPIWKGFIKDLYNASSNNRLSNEIEGEVYGLNNNIDDKYNRQDESIMPIFRQLPPNINKYNENFAIPEVQKKYEIENIDKLWLSIDKYYQNIILTIYKIFYNIYPNVNINRTNFENLKSVDIYKCHKDQTIYYRDSKTVQEGIVINQSSKLLSNWIIRNKKDSTEKYISTKKIYLDKTEAVDNNISESIYMSSINIPTIWGLILMGGFCVFDIISENHNDILKVIKYICEQSINRVFDINVKKQILDDIWFNKQKCEPLKDIPTLLLCAFYHYIGNLPENIKHCDDTDGPKDKLKTIFFKKYTLEDSSQILYLPYLYRSFQQTKNSINQIFYRIEYTSITNQQILYNILECDEDIDRFVIIPDEDINTNSNIENNIFGCSLFKTGGGRCNFMEQIKNKFSDESYTNSEKIIDYLNSSFMIKEGGRTKSTKYKPTIKCSLSMLPRDKIPIINKLYSLKYNESLVRKAYSGNFNRYYIEIKNKEVSKSSKQLDKINSNTLLYYIFNGIDDIGKDIDWINKDILGSIGDISINNKETKNKVSNNYQNLELLLIFRYYRFIRKGKELENKPIWFLNNDELNICWLSTLDDDGKLNHCAPKAKLTNL